MYFIFTYPLVFKNSAVTSFNRVAPVGEAPVKPFLLFDFSIQHSTGGATKKVYGNQNILPLPTNSGGLPQ
jgi:hypothetical protein